MVVRLVTVLVLELISFQECQLFNSMVSSVMDSLQLLKQCVLSGLQYSTSSLLEIAQSLQAGIVPPHFVISVQERGDIKIWINGGYRW